MEQISSSEADIRSAIQEILQLSLNPKIHYYIHISPPLLPILSHINPLHNSPHYFPRKHYSIIFQSMPVSSNWSIPIVLPDQNFVCSLIRLRLRVI